MTTQSADRLYQLLPVVYRLRDADRGYPLRALVQVFAEQAAVLDSDISQLYENWFIETCQEWVVPYLGDLIGYVPAAQSGEPAGVGSLRSQERERLLISRREVANTIRYRRRKGTLAVLEDLGMAVAEWPGRAVEFYRLLGYMQNINYLHPDRGRTVDVRDGDALEDLNGPFEELAHNVDVRCISARHSPERYNIPDVGLFVWRLRSYPVTHAPAYCLEEVSPNYFLFSVLGNDTPLYTRPAAPLPHPPGKLNLPLPISRRDFDLTEPGENNEAETSGVPLYYGDGKSITLWLGNSQEPVPAASIVPADLADWTYRPLPGQIAVDPVLGRIAFPPTQARRLTVWVSYNYGFSADMGGGEYERPLSQPNSFSLYLVGEQETFTHINDALAQWRTDSPANAVIEITDSGVYVEPITIDLKPGQTLQLRAANRKRPVIRLLNWQTSQPDNLTITGTANKATGKAECWCTLDGLIITGRGVQVQGDVAGVIIRHSTLVPGWGLDTDCQPTRPTEPSLELDDAPDCIRIEHSILGSIQVNRDEVKNDPCTIHISDCIVDATDQQQIAIGAPGKLCAFAEVTIKRSTVIGKVQVQEVTLGENSIFMGTMVVCRRQGGCLRFCYVIPGSRTPKRYECQPDLAEAAVSAQVAADNLDSETQEALLTSERLRVEPEFNSVRYGTPTYCQLADACAAEISAGADDESEMGAFHDLYQPQRAENLRVRLREYTPAGMTAGILFAS